MAEPKKEEPAAAKPTAVMCVALKTFYDDKGRTVKKGERYPYVLAPGEELPAVLAEIKEPKASKGD